MLRTVLSLVDEERAIHAVVTNALSDVAMAATSAEPTTIGEWRAAMARFVEPSVVEAALAEAQPGVGTRRTDGGHLIIELAARLLVANTPLGDFPPIGNVQSCDQLELLDLWLPYRIPDDWTLRHDLPDWQGLATTLRVQRAQQLPGDERQVLYGQLASWLVSQWLQRAAALDEPTLQLQEAWLMTPRDDLRQRSPRQVLLARRKAIDADIQDQAENWSITGRCPPPLAASAFAFQSGGFGSHEIILYHEMTTHLLLECERRLRGKQQEGVDQRDEVRHLEQLQQEWLHQPHPALYDQSPAALIARERSRLPAVVPKGHTLEHDDCPLCRMMFESGQPMIWQLDSYALDNCFATSLYDSYEDWEDLRFDADVFDEEPDDEREPGHALCEQLAPPEPGGVWQRSHTNMQSFTEMPPLEACAVMMFSIGGHMAELIFDLADDQEELRRQLHENFDALRRAFKHQEELWMMRAAAQEFADVLHGVSQLRDDLGPKCDDLEQKIQFLCDRYEEHLDPYSKTD